jgi:hypothetical protein
VCLGELVVLTSTAVGVVVQELYELHWKDCIILHRPPSPLGFTIQQTLHFNEINTGLVIELITNPHLVTHLVLVLGLFVVQARNTLLFLYLQSR